MDSVETEIRNTEKPYSLVDSLTLADSVPSVMLWGRRVKFSIMVNASDVHYCARYEGEDRWVFEGHGDSPELALAHLEAEIFRHYAP
jgi:hypothetical protein